ncbi:hypothetical protein Tco_1022224 [Tanacetum coccineum]
MRPFGCPLTILNTLDPLEKFDGKSDEDYLLRYSTTSNAFKVYNKRTKRVEENLHIDFLEYQPNVGGSGPDWMFDLDFLTNTMNYIPVSVENQSTMDAVEDVIQDAQGKSSKNEEQHKLKEAEQALKDDLERMVAQEMTAKAMDDATRHAFEEEKRNIASQKKAAQAASINKLNTGRPSVNTANTPYVSAASTPIGANAEGSSFVYLGGQIPIDVSTLPNADLPSDPNMPDLEDDSDVFPNDGIFSGAYDDEDKDAEADFNNIDNTIDVSPIPTLRIHKVHPKDQILGDPKLAVQTRGKIQKASSVQQALVTYIHKQNRTNHKDHQNYFLACFLSQEEPKKISQALKDESWVEAMQEELLQFKLQKVWILVDLPFGKKSIGTKWVFRNKRDERIKNLVYHSRTKHIEIRHHFIRDCYEKRLIDVVKIHTDNNVGDLLTKGFDVIRFNFLVLELILLGNSMDLRMDGSCASNFYHIWVTNINTGSLGVSTGSGPISTPSVVQTINVTIPSLIKSQREGKDPMTTEEIQAIKRTKAQIQQEEDGLTEAMRLQALKEEEAARQVHLDDLLAKRILEEEELSDQQKKRKAEVQEAAQYYTKEDWDTIRAKLKANTELTKSLQGESMTSEDFAKMMVEMINQKKKFYAEKKAKARKSKPMTQAQQRDYMSTFIKNQSSWKLTQLKKLTSDELKTEFEKPVKSIENFVPMETDERVKRQGVQLKQEFSKKQKTIEEVSVLEESFTESVIAKEEEIEKSIKKRGKIRKQKARK